MNADTTASICIHSSLTSQVAASSNKSHLYNLNNLYRCISKVELWRIYVQYYIPEGNTKTKPLKL